MEAAGMGISMTASEGRGGIYSEDVAYASAVMDGLASVVDGEMIAPLTEPLERYFAKDLRKEVARYKLRVTRRGPRANDNKLGYMELLRRHRAVHAPHVPRHASPIKEQADDAESARVLSLLLQHADTPPASACSSLALEPLVAIATEPARYVEEEDVGRHSLQEIEMESAFSLFEDKPTENHVTQSPTRSSDGNDGDKDADDETGVDESEGSAGSSSSSEEEEAVLSVESSAPGEVEVEMRLQAYEKGSEELPPLDVLAKHTKYWEHRLRVSKRRLRELHDELQQAAAQGEAELLEEELTYYTRERKRALKSLLSE